MVRGGGGVGMIISCAGELNSKSLLCTNQITTYSLELVFFYKKN